MRSEASTLVQLITPPTLNHQRQSDRFYSKNSEELAADLLILEGDDVLAFPVRLADISETGCAVEISAQFNRDIPVAILRIRDIGGTVNLELAGRMCWNQRTSLGANTCGFCFRRPLSNEIIDQMVDNGWVTRRLEPRVRTGAIVEVRRAHGLPTIGMATLQDFSMTGIRLTLNSEVEVGERLLISNRAEVDQYDVDAALKSTKRIANGGVTVKWVRPTDDGYECGCVFQNLAASRAINDAFSTSGLMAKH
ncbi:PilZ domain-containing protein [Neorhodopirellula pilleata]|uniref:PilZ domain protein n=1 Tax=Neorhodopirellula pilleata TaxID=2714738 RepID=A0A5C6A162_9BACT|nr:PilZ domain-containing protein [Neorhodopirellula pilleata]TWT92991.1 PilZ domain protein [Neorhodopirellula pilleata]